MFSVLLKSLPFFVAALQVSARPSSYATWAADSAISRGQGNGIGSDGNPVVSYEHGEFHWALRLLYEQGGNEAYFNYILDASNKLVYDNGTLHSNYKFEDFNLDLVRTGPTFLYLYEKTKNEKWKKAADVYLRQLYAQPRTGEGQFWHKLRYPNQGWLDGIYMGDVFYATYIKRFQPTNQTAWNDITLQFSLQFANTIQRPDDENYIGLTYHGYDWSKTQVWASPDRGHSIEIWDRALGWYAMALVDTIPLFPAAHPGRKILLGILQTLAPRIIKAADPTDGVWWLVMSKPGKAGNYYESSGAVMFIYSILRGIRLGYLPDRDGSLKKGAVKAYKYAIANWVTETETGTLDFQKTVEVGSLSGNGTFEYYIGVPTRVNDLKGLAAFVLASYEYERL